MFNGNAEAMKKMADMMVHVSGSFNRSDMDAADYTKVLNKLAAEGWQLVAVNNSNYWIFRRKK